MALKRVAILTGGGDCPGLNPAIRGAVLRLAQEGVECLGMREGWKGMIEGKGDPLTAADVAWIVGKGGTVLGTSRTNPYKKEGGVEKVAETFKKLGLDALIAMGEDTLESPPSSSRSALPSWGPQDHGQRPSATDYTWLTLPRRSRTPPSGCATPA